MSTDKDRAIDNMSYQEDKKEKQRLQNLYIKREKENEVLTGGM